MREILTVIFVSLGLILFALSALGVVRLPDFFSRLHSSGIGETLGISSLGIGLIINSGFSFTSLKIIMIIVFIFVMNPVGTNLICKAALASGHDPFASNSCKKIER